MNSKSLTSLCGVNSNIRDVLQVLQFKNSKSVNLTTCQGDAFCSSVMWSREGISLNNFVTLNLFHYTRVNNCWEVFAIPTRFHNILISRVVKWIQKVKCGIVSLSWTIKLVDCGHRVVILANEKASRVGQTYRAREESPGVRRRPVKDGQEMLAFALI